MVGSTVAEKVVERQYEEKLMTSRTSTPASAGRSSRRSRVARVVTCPLRVRPATRPAVSDRSRASLDLLARQQHEAVLGVRRPPLTLPRIPVEPQDGHAGPRPPRREPRRLRLGL